MAATATIKRRVGDRPAPRRKPSGHRWDPVSRAMWDAHLRGPGPHLSAPDYLRFLNTPTR